MIDHEVHDVPAYRARGPYVCPGCDASIPVRLGHVVVGAVDRPDDRRLWHRHCWRIQTRRGRPEAGG